MTKQPHPLDIQIGQRLRAVRMARSMSQEALGEQLGISFQQIQKYEKGVNRLSGSRLLDTCRILGFSVAGFMRGIGDPDAESPALPVLGRDELELLSLAAGMTPAARKSLLNVGRAIAAAMPPAEQPQATDQVAA